MKVIIRHVILDGEDFVLIKDQSEMLKNKGIFPNGVYFGTIPYTELDEQGKMKRALNGFEMNIQATANEAIRQRLINIKFQNYKRSNPNATDKMLLDKILKLQETIK